jgi:hypothetical protein
MKRLVAVCALTACLAAGCGKGGSGHTAPTVATPASTGAGSTSAGQLAGGGGETTVSASRMSSAPARITSARASAKPATVADGPCPWIPTQQAADLEGNRIGQVEVSSAAGRVTGCVFHFDTNWGADHIVMSITRTEYADDTAARNAMIRLGSAGSNAAGQPGLAPGVDGIRYQTTFYAPDGASDWAFSFAKGKQVVTVKTNQDDVSANAYNVAVAIVGAV